MDLKLSKSEIVAHLGYIYKLLDIVFLHKT